jgi:hypothetical protein
MKIIILMSVAESQQTNLSCYRRSTNSLVEDGNRKHSIFSGLFRIWAVTRLLDFMEFRGERRPR